MVLTANQPPSRRLDDPQPGYYLVRVVKGGPLVPARIIHEFGMWTAWINGVQQGEPCEDPICAAKVLFIWHSFREVLTPDEYKRRLRVAADPLHPSHEPRKAIDLGKEQPLF